MKLFYRKYGEGQPLIILHGLFGISDNWVTIGRRLAEQYEVYILDQRNHGQSPHSDVFNYYAMVEDLYEFIEEHQIYNPIIIGHSMGGKVAMNFALEHPSKVEKLIIVDMSVREYHARQTHLSIIEAMNAIDLETIESRDQVSEILDDYISSERIKHFILKNLYRINKNRFGWRINLDGVSDNLENVFVGIESKLTFDKASLFIKGSLSDYILKEDYPMIIKIFPQATFETIKGASHWIHAEKPDQLCALFSKFLEKDCDYTV
jgi:pimeloyl-ACP methyl ester carboxylesterase